MKILKFGLFFSRVIRAHTAGHGNRLKPSIEKFHKYEVPKSLKRFLAYDP